MLELLDVFHGEVTPHRALIYARLPRPTGTGWRLQGEVRGPFSRSRRTLPARVELVDCGPGPTLLAQAVLPDPCSWSPESPTWYDVSVVLTKDGAEQAETRRQFGIRRIGPHRNSLHLDGRRFVLRAVEPPPEWKTPRDVDDDRAARVRGGSNRNGFARTADDTENKKNAENASDWSNWSDWPDWSDWEAWRDAGRAMIATAPDDRLCEAATQAGVMIVARLDDLGQSAEWELRRLARWPSVVAVLVDSPIVADAPLRRIAPNLLLVQPQVDFETADWSHAVVVDAEHLRHDTIREAAKRTGRPILARRELRGDTTWLAALSQVDQLQADLAPLGDFAGYFVSIGSGSSETAGDER
ncbi:MAG TPA: hypothetical protein PLV92_19750 [Pirellulaceae bacterium]|nr:hypothetical protein [Pirellulaceae bacterium]